MAVGGPSEHCISGFRHLPCVNGVGRRAISLYLLARNTATFEKRSNNTLNLSPTASRVDLCIRKTVIIEVFHFAHHCYKTQCVLLLCRPLYTLLLLLAKPMLHAPTSRWSVLQYTVSRRIQGICGYKHSSSQTVSHKRFTEQHSRQRVQI